MQKKNKKQKTSYQNKLQTVDSFIFRHNWFKSIIPYTVYILMTFHAYSFFNMDYCLLCNLFLSSSFYSLKIDLKCSFSMLFSSLIDSFWQKGSNVKVSDFLFFLFVYTLMFKIVIPRFDSYWTCGFRHLFMLYSVRWWCAPFKKLTQQSLVISASFMFKSFISDF